LEAGNGRKVAPPNDGATQKDDGQNCPSSIETAAAKERQKRKPADSAVETFPPQNGKARDKAGEAAGALTLGKSRQTV
jgi:hypothetical protein